MCIWTIVCNKEFIIIIIKDYKVFSVKNTNIIVVYNYYSRYTLPYCCV